MQTIEKEARYRQVAAKITAMLKGECDEVARMATISSVLAGEFSYFCWTGFYRMLDGELVVGPFQGTPACLRISLDRGVCGTAATQGKTLLVNDVHDFPGHIACDARSCSEIVVPVWDCSGSFIGVLDVDSEQMDAFDKTDKVWLERIVVDIFGRLGTPCQAL